MKEKHRFILSDEESRSPVRIELKRLECPLCDEIFYVDINATPHYCPYCKERVDLIKCPYQCSISLVCFNEREAHEVTMCEHIGKEQDCATCEKVIEK